MRVLGRGGMGVVWLARDQRLGRRVALKVIDPVKLASAGARDRFQREAAATAALAHPHVVTLYEVGEVDGTPWVALEYIEGDTLRERLADDPPPLREAIAIGRAVAGALAAAHATGILHRDLKPSNVILGKDGRARVVDFGLARRFGEAAPSVQVAPDLRLPHDSDAAGTPRYMAPEQWRREEPAPATDVWGLGLLLHELIWGHHPYEHLDGAGLRMEVPAEATVPAPRTSRAVPPALAELIAGCLAKAAATRPTAAAVEVQLGRLLERATVIDEGESPFRGLAPFGEKHAAAFYGRDGEIAAFLERLREQAILPVVGPSGAGKSSFVHAGVVPRLRERGWTVLPVRPGRAPLAALARRLLGDETMTASGPAPSVDDTTATVVNPRGPRPPAAPARPIGDDLAAALLARPGRLGVELRALAEAQRTRVVLVVDQLEELHAGEVGADERRAFLHALATAADDPAEPVRVIVTVRDDFLGRVAEVDEVRAALSRVTLLRSPGADGLREILIRPAERAGYRWDDGLVDAMVAAVASAPAGLPLLAFTARQMWHRRDRDGRRLTRATYDELGGVAGALAAHADGVIAGLTGADEAVVREALLRLVSPERTRRAVSRVEVTAGLPATADELVQRLVDARLVITRRAAGGDAELELAHDSLIHAWERLARWIDEGHDDRAFLEHATRAAARWAERGRRDDDVWQGRALADARRSLARLGARAPAPVRALLAASERRARRARWRRRGAYALVVVALAAIAVTATVAALRIAREERHARHRFAEAQIEAAAAARASGDLLAARAHVRGALEVEDSLRARALWLQLAAEPLAWTAHTAAATYDLAVSPDGRTVAAVGQDGAVRLIDRATGAVDELAGVGDQLFAVAWAPDGRWLAAGTWDGQIRVWAWPARTVHAIAAHHGIVDGLVFVGDTLWSAGADGALRAWDAATGARRGAWSEGGPRIAELVALPDGALVTASWDGAIRRWQGGVATVIGRHDGPAIAVTVAGDRLVSGGHDRVVRVWTAAGGQLLAALDEDVARLAYDPVTARVVVGTARGRLRALALTTDADELVLTGHAAGVRALAVAGGRLISGGSDDAIRAWDLTVRPRRPDPGHLMTVVGVDVAADGATAISAGYDHDARRWDLATGRTTAILRGHRDRVWAARFLPDGRVVTGSADGTLRLWDGAATVAVAPLALATGEIYDVAVAPGGGLIAAGATDGRVHLWEPARGAVRAIDVVTGGTVDAVAISPDGRRVAAGASDAVVYVFDLATGARLAGLRGHAGPIPGLAFSPDGRRLASSGEDGVIWLWDLDTGAGRALWRGARSYRIAFHPGGRLIGATAADGLTRLLDLDGGPPRELRGHAGEVNEVRFSADGAIAVTGGNDATVRVWDVTTGAPRWTAPETAIAPVGGAAPAVPAGLDDLPPSAPTRVAGGPAGTLAVGFATGELGLWDPSSGLRLDRLRVHGAVVGLAVEADHLRAISELGDVTEVDLTPLVQPYCDLLREIWRRVEVGSHGRRPARMPPPREHRCRRG
jgi:WD40 repeat protein